MKLEILSCEKDGVVERTVYACPCGKGTIEETQDYTEGHRDGEAWIHCPNCRDRYYINYGGSLLHWELSSNMPSKKGSALTMADKKKSHARITYMPLKTPNTTPVSKKERKKWIDDACAGFVSPSKKNKEYYRVILETLWPENHGIPGPLVEESQIRAAIDKYRGSAYVDTFRRVRELQGEEGFLGIVKGGNKYQLIDLTIHEKRIPRTHLNGTEWTTVLGKYENVCAACGRSPADKGFQQDHKVPRLRGGSDDLENWQPLCDECNNFKSTACRDCQLDCSSCCWAYPEKYKPIPIPGEIILAVRNHCKKNKLDPAAYLADLLNKALSK